MRESSIILFSALALSSTCANAQGSWGRRIYYNDNSCSTTIGYQEHVFLPQAPCALSTSPPINTVCENKSTNARVPSSEGTGCDNVPTNKDVSDAPYFPPAGQRNKIEGANYLTVNLYNAASCGVGKGDVSITQIMYAADGKCHVMEPGMYFKASCNSAAGVVEWCDDDQCSMCSPAKALIVRSDCAGPQIQGQPARSTCVLAPGAVDKQLPSINGTTLPTGTVTSPVPSSTSSPTSSSAPSGATGEAKNSGSAGGAAGIILAAIGVVFTHSVVGVAF